MLFKDIYYSLYIILKLNLFSRIILFFKYLFIFYTRKATIRKLLNKSKPNIRILIYYKVITL